MSPKESILFPTGQQVSDRKFHEAGVRGRFEPNLRVVRGLLTTTAPGTVDYGSGFTVANTAVGHVTVTFSPEFSAVPTVIGTSVNPTNNATVVWIEGTPTATQVKFTRNRLTVGDEDGQISFYAIGPI